jgi:hypothetical protein
VSQISRKLLDAMPSDIAAIGEEFSRAIHEDHRSRKARRARVRRAIIVVAVMGVGSGTALAAKLALAPGYVLNPCIAHAIQKPGLYTSLEEMHKACHLPGRATPRESPPPPLRLPNASSPGVRRARIAGTMRGERAAHVPLQRVVGGT